MRIGLLGSGEMGKRHLAAAADLSEVEMITRTTPPYNALDPANRAGLLSAMLADPTIDAIDICLPTPLHMPTTLAALAARKHVLCEKPLALTTADCARMLAAAQESDRVFMVAHVLRFFPAYQHLLGVVRSGVFGPVQHASFTRVSGIPRWATWLTETASSGGAILDLLVHDFDQVIALFGPPSHIEAVPIESTNTVLCLLNCGEIPVRVEGGWFADNRPFAMSFEVEFKHESLIYRNEHLVLHRAGTPGEEILLASVDPYREQLRYFTQCCTSGAAPIECPPEASAATVALALAVREQAARTPGPEIP